MQRPFLRDQNVLILYLAIIQTTAPLIVTVAPCILMLSNLLFVQLMDNLIDLKC